MSQTEQSAEGSLPPAGPPAPGTNGPRSAWPLRLAILGVAALLVAACIPPGASLVGPLSFREAMLLLLQAVVIALVGRFILEFVLRGRSRIARGLGLLLVGLLVLGESGYTTWLRVDTNLALQDLRQAVLDAQALRGGDKTAAARLAPVGVQEAMHSKMGVLAYALAAETRRTALEATSIETRYTALDPSSILGTDEVLLSADAIMRARARQSTLLGLLDEQAALVESILTRSEAIHRDADFSDEEADELVKAFEARRELVRNAYREFDKASRAATARREEMLTYAQANLGGIRLRDGNLRFRSRALKAAYDKLDEAVGDAESAEQKAFDALVKQRTESLRVQAEHMATLVPTQP